MWFHTQSSNHFHFMSFYANLMIGSSFFALWSEVFNYIKIISMLCMFPTKNYKNLEVRIFWPKFFQIYHLLFSKNNFFEVVNFLEIFLGERYFAYLPCIKNLGCATEPDHTLKLNFRDLGVFFGPFLTPERSKIDFRRVNRQNNDLQNMTNKIVQYSAIF